MKKMRVLWTRTNPMTEELRQTMNSLDDLPARQREASEEIARLDREVHKIMRYIQKKTNIFIAVYKRCSAAKKTAFYNDIDAKYAEALELSAQKQAIAKEMCGLMDEKIREMDQAAVVFNQDQRRKYKEKLDAKAAGGGRDTSLPNVKTEGAQINDDYGNLDNGGGRDTSLPNVKTEGAQINDDYGNLDNGGGRDTSLPNVKTEGAQLNDDYGNLDNGVPALELIQIPSEDLKMPIDPNEPTYCICKQVSFGRMVMCEDSNCPIEWFHFDCVGLTEAPTDDWFCEACTKKNKKISKNKKKSKK